MTTTPPRHGLWFLAVTVLFTATAACAPKTDNGGSGGSDGSGEIVIGTSIPLSGTVASFGGFQKWGYQRAVNEANAAGGLTIGGKKRKVKLVVRDDKSDPNTTSANVRTLISGDKATALLGSCTPTLVNAGALVADRERVPMVTACDPLGAFTAVKKWTHVWDLFFAEPDAAELVYQTLAAQKSPTNKKIAILHDNGPDGQGLGKQAWPGLAAKYGYKVVQNIEFPTDNTDFSSAVQQAKNSGADILLVDSSTPQAVSIRKQMATSGYTPKVLVMEKGGEPVQFAQALGNLANGSLVAGYWDPAFPYPGAKALGDAYAKETGQSVSQHIADSYTAAKVLLAAIQRAGSTDREKINSAIRQTNATYPAGPVKFDSRNTATLQVAELQWQNGKTVVVWPTDRKTGSFLFPVPAS
jgi:branched-chain amino acid transport system substrate-binding protein